jgi:Xaa-Pro aminopeptidase
MTALSAHIEETVGAGWDRAAMRAARRHAHDAVNAIAAALEPGMTEVEADRLARDMLKARGLLRGWHTPYVAFGAHTIDYYDRRPCPDTRLGEQDIAVVDIGPVWQGWEADYGDTFVFGQDPEMLRAQADVRRLFAAAADKWRDEGLTGDALYAFAAQEAERLGWRFNGVLAGHRVSDFPHKLHFAGELSAIPFVPAPDAWVLEVHIFHPDGRFGAFVEDLLTD